MAEKDVVAEGIVADKGNDKAATDGNPQGNADWAKGLDEGIQKKLERFKGDPQALAKSYVELETYASKSFQDMSEPEKEKYLKRLGLPEKPEEYELSAVEMPKELARSATADADFKAFVHSARLTKGQAKQLHEWASKRALDTYNTHMSGVKKQTEEREGALRTEWGTAYQANLDTTDKLLELGGKEFAQRMKNGDAVVRKGFYELSKHFNDETLVSGRVDRPQPSGPPSGFVFDPGKSPELRRGPNAQTIP